jgi:hypothetical protein
MFSLRLATRVMAAAALLGAAFGEAHGQTAGNQATSTPEIAKAVASAINANTVATPGQPMALESATSHDNVVELRYVVNDPASFARLKNNLELTRSVKAAFYCKKLGVAFLNRGVVMHEVMATSTHSDQIDFTVDKSSCAGLPKVSAADAGTVATLALSAAKSENETTRSPSHTTFGGATAHQGIVDERFTVPDSARAGTQANRGKIASVLTGYVCTRYHDVIFQGVAFHDFFVATDDSPLIDFTIDGSSC